MIRVVLAEDQAMVRGAFAQLLDLQPDVTVVATAGNGDEALAVVAEHRPDVLLTDLDLPLDAVISIEVSRAELVRRLAGRWICRRCGRSFHEVFNPYPGDPCPKGDGSERCDLYQREDDRPETVENRLSVYDEQTAPLIDYYRSRGLLREVEGFLGLSPQDDYPRLNERVHASGRLAIPDAVERRLADRLAPQAAFLADEFGPEFAQAT